MAGRASRIPTSSSAWRWAQRNFFASVGSAVTTAVYVVLLVYFVPKLLDWAVIDATFTGTQRSDCDTGGACWTFIRVWSEQILFGRYPVAERWRIGLLGALLIALFAGIVFGEGRVRFTAIVALTVGFPVVAIAVIRGGLLGMTVVDSSTLGGLSLNILLAVTAGSLSLPLGIGLALARRSDLVVIRTAATVYIEFWRGVPLITVLFTALILLPLFLPESWTLSALLRAYIALTIVYAAYIAEVVRGGLQIIPPGQGEAADALGLAAWQRMAFVVLPQALRHVVPAIVNTLVELFKDSTLVYMIGLFDVLGVLSLALRDIQWIGLSTEAYVVVAIIYFVCCRSISLYGQWLERR